MNSERPDNRGKVWTTANYQELRDLYAEGVSLEYMSDVMGRAPGALVAKLVELGLLTLINRNYHRVEQDPWIDWPGVKLANEAFEQRMPEKK